MTTDYLVVGSGLTGAVIARHLHDRGGNVLVVDRRDHLGGNVHDHVHPSGIRVHTYGPHYFRTNSAELWKFVNRFDSFYRYEAELKSEVDGRFENWPIAASYIRKQVGADWTPEFRGTPNNFEEASLAMMPRVVYDKFVKGYTEKQWGVRCDQLSTDLAGRFDVRENDEPRLKTHRYQGIPVHGYAEFMKRMLAGIPVLLNCDYLAQRDAIEFRKKLIFTGPIDEFFGFRLGRLKYRGQRRTHEYHPEVRGFAQPCGQVNSPDAMAAEHIRTLEWKHMMEPQFAEQIQGTVLTRETTITPEDPSLYEYPFPDRENADLYKKYRELAAAESDVLICGRLGEYRYYDMDQAIGRAMTLAESLLVAS